MREQFLLNPEIIFLNHGSFGATPRPVFEQYQKWQRELEFQPVEFIGRRYKELLGAARSELGAYFHTKPENLVYMTNVTVALNAVARSLSLGPLDEVLTTDQEYGAFDRTWRFLSEKQGFKYINTHIDVPVTTPEKYVNDFWKAVTPATRVIFISHISSPTSIIAPVKELVQRAQQAGILTIIDGAHVAGQIPLDLEDIGADFYGGNLHKWLCAPKGTGFLYASPWVQTFLEPLVVSFGWESEQPGPSPVVDYYEYIGTRDISGFLSVPAAIEFQEKNHWDQVRLNCHHLAQECMERFYSFTHLEPLYSPQSNWYAQMVTIPIPNGKDLNQIKTILYDQYRIEVPFVTWKNNSYIRVSFQAYNTREDMLALISAIRNLL